MPEPDQRIDVRLSLEKSLKVLARWTIALYLCVSVVFGFLLLTSYAQRRELRDNVDRIDVALCTFVGDLQARVDQTREFLAKHSGPEPFPGVSRADMRLALRRSIATLNSLDGLECNARS